MHAPRDLIATLGENPQFHFHLSEYVESSAVMTEVRTRIRQFTEDWTRLRKEVGPRWHNWRDRFRTVCSCVPAYSQIDWGGDDYWQTIPPIDKTTLLEKTREYINPNVAVERRWQRPTSGTSGVRLDIWYAPESFFEAQYFGAAKIAWMYGVSRDELCRPRTVCLNVHDKRYLSNRLWGPPDGSIGMTLRYILDEAQVDASAEVFALVRKERPAILSVKPNILELLLFSIDSTRREDLQSVKIIISSGGLLTQELKDLAIKKLCVPVMDTYAMSEIGAIASECKAHACLHVHPRVIVEVLCDDGVIRAEGAGELVVSSFNNRVMPLLRYRTADYGKIDCIACTCGRRGCVITELAGRIMPNFVLPSGVEISPSDFDKIFGQFPISQWCLTQAAPSEFNLEVEFTKSVSKEYQATTLDTLRTLVLRRFSERIALTVRVINLGRDSKFQRYRRLVPVGTMRGSK